MKQNERYRIVETVIRVTGSPKLTIAFWLRRALRRYLWWHLNHFVVNRYLISAETV